MADLFTQQELAWLAENMVRGAQMDHALQMLVTPTRSMEQVLAGAQALINHPVMQGALRGRQLWVRRLAKAQWHLMAQARLVQQRSVPQEVPVLHRPSTEQFYDDFYHRNLPVVITGAMADWPALRQWTLPQLRERFAGCQVEAQTRRNQSTQYETQAEQHTDKVLWEALIDRMARGPSNDFYITARNSGWNRQQLAPLWDEIGDLDTYLEPMQPRAGFFWCGPQGTITPTHHDLTNNMMAQVLGRKRVSLCLGHNQPYLYNHLHVFSRVDISRLDLEAFPQMSNVRVMQVVLEPGQLLFLPVGCWHHVESLDVSITMTYTNFKVNNDFTDLYAANGEL